MAGYAFGCLVRANKGEATLPVQGCNVLNYPGFRGMASLTIRACRVFMDINMAIHASCFGIGKCQRGMAEPACCFPVTTLQGKDSVVVVE
jgi:hypothetical protein